MVKSTNIFKMLVFIILMACEMYEYLKISVTIILGRIALGSISHLLNDNFKLEFV
jgi:hypothetical protein